jgi:hypothetical protein
MRRKTSSRRAKKTNTLTDLEVAKKMIKIFQSAVDRKLEFDLSFITVKKLYKILLENKTTGKEQISDQINTQT